MWLLLSKTSSKNGRSIDQLHDRGSQILRQSLFGANTSSSGIRYYENRLCKKICETSTPKKDNSDYKFEYIQKDDLKQIVLFKNGENYYQQMRKKIYKKMATKGV